MKMFFRLDKAQKIYFSDFLKSICLLDLAGVGYQFISGTTPGVLVMALFAIILAATGVLVVKGTDS